MHYYDCPCEECRGPDTDTVFQRVLSVIERLEQELARPPLKEYERALAWLEAACGGPAGVRALDTRPLTGPVTLPEGERVGEVAGLLDGVARQFYDAEAGWALRRGLARVWAVDPGLVTAPALPAYVAAGVAWAVGEANGLVGPDRRATSTRLKYALEVPGSPATYARPIRAALRGLWPWHSERGPTTPMVSTLGHLDLLTSATRAQLVRVREHALAAREADRAVA
jgi:hypothetical protein